MKMTILSIIALALIFLGGIGGILLAVSQSLEASKTKQDIIRTTQEENLKLKDQLLELRTERDSLKLDLEQRDERIQQQTSMLQAKSDQIIGLQQESIEQNEYRNFMAGIVWDEPQVEQQVKEWFKRVKAAGINPPRYSRIIYIKLSERTSSLIDYRIAPTRFPDQDNTKVVIIAYRDNGVSVWRGLTHVLLDKEIIPMPHLKSLGTDEIPPEPDELMYNGFVLEHYDTASAKKQDSYWSQMLDLHYPGAVH